MCYMIILLYIVSMKEQKKKINKQSQNKTKQRIASNCKDPQINHRGIANYYKQMQNKYKETKAATDQPKRCARLHFELAVMPGLYINPLS